MGEIPKGVTVRDVYLGVQKGLVRRREPHPDGYTIIMPDEDMPGRTRVMAIYGDRPTENKPLIPTPDDPDRTIVFNRGGYKAEDPFIAGIKAGRKILKAAKKDDRMGKLQGLIDIFTNKW